MTNKNLHEPVKGGFVFENIPVDAVCPMVMSQLVLSVRIPSPYKNSFYIGVIPKYFADSLMLHCTGELFICTMVPFGDGYILYVDPAQPDNQFPF